jgi:NAD(P)-dependent dehydrogenase (short-subunit alcohol dehydrogenase family)
MDFSLAGKVAVVTGGAGGIGRAYLRTLAEAGAAVVVADLDGEAAAAFASELAADGLTALAVAVDVGDEESARLLARRVREAFGGIDVLVNNAALTAPAGPLLELPIEAWDRVLKVNVGGALICAQACVPSMIERGGGKIVNTASLAAFSPMFSGAYSVSKLALVGLTANLARELGPANINVNAIAPGVTRTGAAVAAVERQTGGSWDEWADERARVRATAMRPWAPPEGLCGALLLLASSAGDHSTGQCLNVDNGEVMRL